MVPRVPRPCRGVERRNVRRDGVEGAGRRAYISSDSGPWDIEMARELRPNTIRGMFGVDKVRNVVHCTDLESDAVAECEYIFKLMQ